jgi:polysaccharide pyruvyl transferase WcaK-like protein
VTKNKGGERRISFFGHFGLNNFGNESTLQAILYHCRRLLPDAEVTCICTGPEAAANIHNIATIPISGIVVRPWATRNVVARVIRKICIGVPAELYRWLKAFVTLRGTDMLIIPGTGLLTDAYGVFSWGPYSMFKWTLVAKLAGCKVFFVSVGGGPIYGTFSRWLVKAALSFADFRSYRDNSTLQYLKGIGVGQDSDRIYPDLAFSLPEVVIPRDVTNRRGRPVVGLGLMEYAGKYSVKNPSDATYVNYVETLLKFVGWLLGHDYDVRLLIGDVCDRRVTREFKTLLKQRLASCDEEHVIEEPVCSVAELLSQLAATDIVVATRFHNVLLALLLGKPVIAITFHHKCVSLMSQMGLSEYCQDINCLDAERLIEQFCDVEHNWEKLKPVVKNKVEECRRALDEQYKCILN